MSVDVPDEVPAWAKVQQTGKSGASATAAPLADSDEAEQEDYVKDEWAANYNVHLICPDCREFPPRLTERFSTGDTICDSCAMVLLENTIDTRSEWRSFSNDDSSSGDDPSRVGSPVDPMAEDSALTTEISSQDARGSTHGLLRAQRAVTGKTKKSSHQEAFDKIDAYATASRLPPNVAKTACALFREAQSDRTFRNKSQDSLIAGTLFFASRQHNSDRTFKHLQDLTGVPKKDIGRVFKALCAFLVKLSAKRKTRVINGVVLETQDFRQAQFSGARTLCAGYASHMGLNSVIQSLATLIAEKMDKSGVLSGRSPLSISGACIYAASHLMGNGRTPREIAEVVGAGDSTIKAVYKDIFTNRDILIDEDWLKARGSSMAALPVP